MIKSRNIKFDTFKGILIYLVVLGHLTFSYKYYTSDIFMDITKFIYSFHMPLFLMISGYYSKEINKKNLIKLFLLFLIVNISYNFYDYITIGEFNIFNIKYSSWYLLAIFIYRSIIMIPNIKLKIKPHKKIISCLLFILSIVIGLFEINNILSKIISFTFFFFIGLTINDKNLNKLDKYKYNKLIFIISIFLLLTVNIPFSLNFFMAGKYQNTIEVIFRISFYYLNILLFYIIYRCLSKKKIKFFTNIGKNSLYIYIYHRIITLIITDYFIQTKYFSFVALICSFLICILFGNDFVKKYTDKLLDIVINCFYKNKIKVILIFFSLFICLYCFQIKKDIIYIFSNHDYIDYKKNKEIENSISIGFIGDLILLEDQVKNSYQNGKYNFDYMFKYTNKYFKEVDYMIGVLEGPIDDNKKYSNSNYDDGKKIMLNYPSDFIKSIKNSGIDLVTIANNHLIDKGMDSIPETISNLNKNNLEYIGGYTDREQKEKTSRKIINIENAKIGILAYTYGLNYYTEDEIQSNYQDFSNYLCNPSSKYLKRTKKEVEEDFKYLKSQKVDFIIVLPHYGTQFKTEPDNFQKYWNEIFIKNGASIILGSHSHSVQPIQYKKESVIINSVGNYVNSYTKYNGDVSMMVKIYLNKNKKNITAISVIPLLAVKNEFNAYYSLPLYDAYHNDNLKNKYSNKLRKANDLVTKISMNANIKYKNIEKEYLYINNSYKKGFDNLFKFNKENTNNIIYKKLKKTKKLCFVGDSITEGTKNNFHPWYEELVKLFDNNIEIKNFSKGGYTTVDIINNYQEELKQSNCDLTIINIGTNNIRYYETKTDDYISNINKIISYIDDGDIILLSPWRTTNKDKYMKNNRKIKKELYDNYDKSLLEVSKNNNKIYYKDVNKYIKNTLKEIDENIFLTDDVHPNETLGVKLYSYSILK